MSNPRDFIIENGVLKKYKGPGGDVVIPEGVTSVGKYAFKYCRALKTVTIPESVKSIGDWAFHNCSALKTVTIPKGVTSIGDHAFSGCSALESVTIPEGVESIGDWAFRGCSALESVTIPDGVTSIGNWAFEDCHALKTVTIPESVTSISVSAFQNCNKLRIVTPAGWARTKKKLPTAMTKAAYCLDEEDLAWVLLFQSAKGWKKDGLAAAEEKDAVQLFQKQLEMIRGAKKNPSALASNALDVCFHFSRVLPAELVKDFADVLQEKKCEAQLDALKEDLTLCEKLLGGAALANLNDTNRLMKEKLDAAGMTQAALAERLKTFLGLKTEELPELLDAKGRKCSPTVLSWLLTAHETICRGAWDSEITAADWKQPGLRPEAAEIVAVLDPASLQAAVKALADRHLEKYQNTKKKFLTYPVCRYADEAAMAELTKRAPGWRTSVSGNDAPPLLQLRDAVKYSDTRAAMLFAERYGELGEYAALRGMTEDELRDQNLSDVGLDERGGKAYDLGNQTVTARLQRDLTFLFELPSGKTAKSLPKKGADEAKYTAAKADFDEMRKSVKKILKSRGAVLFQDFLSGRRRGSAEWQAAYLKNPLLRMAGGQIVWAQGKKTFTLTDDGAVDSALAAYAITDQPIRVAHPMEMQAEDVTAWQKYFSSRALKQPFAQVWEPVIDPQTIREDRYDGSVQPMYRFTGKDKHGIHGGNLSAFSEDIGFELDDCELEYEASTWRVGWDASDAYYTLGEFTFRKYTRKVNHIVSLLDRWTVEDRVRKDDVSVMEQMDRFTLAQLTEFIQVAQEANAINVLSLLLEYKNTHFADFDPMEEFTLEW